MAETSGRVICSQFNYDDAGRIISTTLYFGNGQKLVVEGYWHMPHLVTVKFKHKKNGDNPDTIKSIDLVAG